MSTDATRDALNIIDRRHFSSSDMQRDARMDDYRAQIDIAQMIYDMRTSAGLSQAELARRVGTTQSVISRLEDADYSGHSLTMLFRIARALGKTLRIQILDASDLSEPASSDQSVAA